MSHHLKILFLILFILFEVQSTGSILHQQIVDGRKMCVSNLNKKYILPSGGGEITSLVVYLSTNRLKCRFDITSFFYDIGLIVVIEFIEQEINCKSGELILQDTFNSHDICQNINNGLYLHKKIMKNITILVNFTNSTMVYDLKLVFTAANLIANNLSSCEESGKISCSYGNENVCIHRSLQCNGFNNCGEPGKMDENIDICQAITWKIWLFVVCTVLFLIFCIILLLHNIRKSVNYKSEYYYIVDNYQIIPPQVNVNSNEEYQTISLKQDYETIYDDSFEPSIMPSTSLSRNTYLTRSSLTNSTLRYKMERFKTELKSAKDEKLKTNKEIDENGIKITYYET